MDVPVVKFNRQNKPEFFRELRSRVNQYFQDKKISKHANMTMIVKTIFMICLYTVPLVLMLTGVVSGLWPVLAMWLIMGFGMSGLGLSVMHDANLNWKIQHNVLHHSFTNVHGFDEDIEKGVMRFSPLQERKSIFKFQAFYAPLLYGLMTIYWLLVKDFEQLVRYNKKNLLEQQGTTFGRTLIMIILSKLLYVGVTIVLPLLFIDLPWWQIMLGFLMMQFVCGLVLALIFQPAHVLEETTFYVTDENGSVENNWAIHQMHTTSNFANKNYLLSWFVGGLNFQIEHHLFPNICHVHYRALSKIVKATAKEYDVPYHEHETFIGALKSHFTLLHKLGTGSYDRELASA